MKKRLPGDIGSIRREQIVEAAIAIIAEQGLQQLSLSGIEERAGMSRGQLTYYFPAKEEILLAVFDRLLQMLHERAQGSCVEPVEHGWERIRHFLQLLLVALPAPPEFYSLQYTFLSQISHRDDFRQRLADVYESWRQAIAEDVAAASTRHAGSKRISARAVATLIQAILHGLSVQRAADPNSYDREEMLELCLELLGNYLRPPEADAAPTRRKKALVVNGSTRGGPGPRALSSKGSRVQHE